jgi:glycosidase
MGWEADVRQRLLTLVALCFLGAWPVPRAEQPPAAPKWADEVLYFAIVDRFVDGDPGNNVKVDRTARGAFHGGDLKGLREHLDEIADLGVTALWITPVVKNIDGFVTGAGFPDWAYHGYWADDFTRLDRRFGSEADLAALAQACDARGIKLILDVVYNHVGYGSQYLTRPGTRAWFRSPDAGSCGDDDVTSCVAGLPDLRTELPQVAKHLLDAHLGLAERVGLEGFRLDTVKHVGLEFWRAHRARVRERLGRDFFLLGEVWGGDADVLDPWFAADALDAGFDFSFQGNVVGFLQGRGRAVALDRYLQARERVRPGYLLSHFLSSHDVPGALYQLGGDRDLFRLAAVIQFTAAGLPLVYYGEEVGRPGGDWPENRSDMPWGDRAIRPGAGLPRDEGLRDDYRRLIAIRRAHPSLWRGRRESLKTDGDVLVFARHDEASGESVVVAVNRAGAAAPFETPLPTAWSGRTLHDAWRETPVVVRDGVLAATVPGRQAVIIVSRNEKP